MTKAGEQEATRKTTGRDFMLRRASYHFDLAESELSYVVDHRSTANAGLQSKKRSAGATGRASDSDARWWEQRLLQDEGNGIAHRRESCP